MKKTISHVIEFLTDIAKLLTAFQVINTQVTLGFFFGGGGAGTYQEESESIMIIIFYSDHFLFPYFFFNV